MPLVPSYIENLDNYIPGKPIEEVQRNLGLDHVDKLASNETVSYTHLTLPTIYSV